MPKFSNRAVQLGTLNPGDTFVSVFSAPAVPIIHRVVGHFVGNTVCAVDGSQRTKTVPSITPVLPEITNNEDTITMNQQETSVYYMVHNRTAGGMPSVTHADYATAVEEARRLAKANPGVDFVIMKAAVSVTVKAPEPTITSLG